MKSFVTLLLSSAVLAQQENGGKCYALVFSGGDQSAAYQAGVLQGLVQQHGSAETAYSAVTGIAGGAVNAAILGSYPVGNELSAADRMIKFWQNSANTKLYNDWIGGVA